MFLAITRRESCDTSIKRRIPHAFRAFRDGIRRKIAHFDAKRAELGYVAISRKNHVFRVSAAQILRHVEQTTSPPVFRAFRDEIRRKIARF